MSEQSVALVHGGQQMVMQQAPGLEFVQHLVQYERLSDAIARSGLVNDRRPEAVLAKMLKGFELGIPPMTAQQVVYFFDGKTVVDAHAQLGIAASRCGVKAKVVHSDDKYCEILFTRPGWEPVTTRFSIEDARNANLLNKDNWKKYPTDMLYARAITRGLKRIAPDALSGVYDRDEIGPSDRESESGPAVAAVVGPRAGHRMDADSPLQPGEIIVDPESGEVTVLADEAQLADLRALAASVGKKTTEWLEEEIEKGIAEDAVPRVFATLNERLEQKRARAAARQQQTPPVTTAPADSTDPLEAMFGAGAGDPNLGSDLLSGASRRG